MPHRRPDPGGTAVAPARVLEVLLAGWPSRAAVARRMEPVGVTPGATTARMNAATDAGAGRAVVASISWDPGSARSAGVKSVAGSFRARDSTRWGWAAAYASAQAAPAECP